MKNNDLNPGDLVGWKKEINEGKVLEAGVVLELVDRVDEDNKVIKGAKIVWESGVFWSPIDLMEKLEEDLHEVS